MLLKSFVPVEKEGRYLLIPEAGKKWTGKWFLPGGKVEVNETLENAARRETREEAGCEINITGIFYSRNSKDFLEHYLSIFFLATIEGEETIKKIADKHSLEAKWFTYEEIRHLPLHQNLQDIIKNYNKNSILPIENFKIM